MEIILSFLRHDNDEWYTYYIKKYFPYMTTELVESSLEKYYDDKTLNYEILLIYKDGEKVGSVSLEFGAELILGALFVLEEYRRQGIAECVIKDIERRNRGKRIKIPVVIENESARKLYEKLGYSLFATVMLLIKDIDL